MKLVALCALLALAIAHCYAATSDDPSTGSTSSGQSIADDLKSYTSAEIALVPAGLMNQPLQKNDLATMLSYPSEGIVVIELTGSQIRQALERSASLFPQPNVGFLQIAGLEVTIKKSGAPDSRVTSVTVNGSKLEDAKAYQVAMPSSLQRGQLGYSNLWDKAKVTHSFSKITLQDVLKDKHVVQSSPRWVVV